MSILTIGPVLLLACSMLLVYGWMASRKSMVRNLSVQAEIIGANCESAIVFADPASAKATLGALKAQPHIVSAGIYTPDGRIFARYDEGSETAPEDIQIPADGEEFTSFSVDSLVVMRRIESGGKTIGAAYIRSDLTEIYNRLEKFAAFSALVLAGSILLGLVISSRLQQMIVKPILELAETAQRVSEESDFSLRAKTFGNDEIGTLVETFNNMLGQIQERDAALESARENLEIRVKERTAELAATNKELEAFTYSVSHDLRGPLRHIDGFSKLVMEEVENAALSEDVKRYITYIREGTQQMGHLVDDLLNLSRVGRKELSVQVVGLNSLVESVVIDLKRENPNRNIVWMIQALPFVECDPTLMRQVFVNLLSNAVKYTRPRPEAVIEVGTMSHDGERVVFVKDNGVGFSMKYVNKLFGVFQRLHRSEDFEGTGVGLATVQRIIHKHGGRIWAEGTLDQGAAFYFKLQDQNQTIPDESGRLEEVKHE